MALTAWLGVLAGCASTAGTSACTAPAGQPVTLSGTDRRDPVVATDGGAAAVAAWESNTGGPVESSRRSGRDWTATAAISRAGGRDPSVAMSPDGVAVAVWQWQPVGGDRTIEIASARPGGTWTAPAMLSEPGASARGPQVGMDGSGRATVIWRRDASGDDAVVEVAEQGRGGAWGMPRRLSAEGTRARRPRLAVAPNGAAAAVWEQRIGETHGVAAAVRTPDGAWSRPAVVSTGVRSTQEPDVAIGPLGATVAVWIGRDGGGIGVFAAEHGPNGWSAPIAIGRGDDRPRELSRPGRADTAADVAVLPDGRAVAAWTLVTDGANRLGLAIANATGRWAPPEPVPGPGGPAGGVQVTPATGGGALLTWEELDGGLIRARAQLVAADRDEGCTDLSTGRSETGSVRAGGGSAPVAVFVDLNRGRVKAADLP